MPESWMIHPFVAAFIYFTYYIIGEFYFQKTVAKHVTRSIVVNEYGERPDFKTICLRTFSCHTPEPILVLLDGRQSILA